MQLEYIKACHVVFIDCMMFFISGDMKNCPVVFHVINNCIMHNVFINIVAYYINDASAMSFDLFMVYRIIFVDVIMFDVYGMQSPGFVCDRKQWDIA